MTSSQRGPVSEGEKLQETLNLQLIREKQPFSPRLGQNLLKNCEIPSTAHQILALTDFPLF